MINCALSSSTIEKLYKSIYKHMAEAVKADKSFNSKDYIAYVYANKSDVSTPENAAKLVQHIPRMIIDVYNSDFIENQNFEINLQELDRLTKKFLNPDRGVLDIINEYKESSLKFLRKMANSKELEQGTIDEIDLPESVEIYSTPERLKPFSALTGTSQEFLAADPDSVLIEETDESKKHVYAALKSIKEAINLKMPSSVVDDLVYQGTKLKVKAVKLNSIDQNELDPYTKNLIVRSRTLTKQGKQQEDVVPADDLAIIMVTNDAGAPLYFDDNGNITSKEEGGKLVYQFLRNVRKKGDTYSVTNIYGYKSVLSPQEIIKSLKLPKELLEEITREQQEEFRMLDDLQQRVVKNNEEVILPITEISEGVLYNFVGKEVPLSELSKFSDIDKSVYKSITTIENDRGLLKKGYAVITINGAQMAIDRADAPQNIIREVATVLTNKDLPFFVRYEFYNQFFNNKIDIRARRHYTSVNLENNELIFNYSNQTYQQNAKRKMLDNSIDLSDSAIANMSEQELKQVADNIVDVLARGKGKDGNFFSTKMTFNAKSLESERYMRYDSAANEIIYEDYVDFVKTLPARVTLAVTNKDVFNNYIYFGTPSKLSEDINKIKETISVKGPVRTIKDSLVESLKADGPIDTSVVSRKSGEYKGKAYANFQVAIPGQTETAKVYFPNKSTKVETDGILKEDPNWPAQGQEVRLELRNELAVDGKVFKDVIEVYRIYQDGTKGAYIGVIAEKDVSEYIEPAVTEESEEISEPQPTQEIEEIVEAIDYQEKINPVITPEAKTESNDLFNKNWKGLDRSNILDNKVSQQEIEDAKEWFSNSPLSKFIELETITNIVNSDAYARFIVSGNNVYNSAVLGQIKIYEPLFGPKGTMVDVYHEAWHAFSQLFLTKAEKKKLYDEVSKTLNTKDYLKIEERLAEDFREYAKNKKAVKASPVKKSLFQRMLDFLRALFGGGKSQVTAETTPVNINSYPEIVQELFEKLYTADKFNLKLASYLPSVDNVMFDMLNRGIVRSDKPKDDALSRQDSGLIVDSIDSVLSETIDKLNDNYGVKSSTTKLLTDPQNKAIAYDVVKEEFLNKIAKFKEDLGNTAKVSFNSFNSVQNLEDNAAAIIRHAKGDHKYIFLSSQIDDFTNLLPDTKGGERIKGQDYFGIKIISDFFEHKNIKAPDGEGVDIIIVNSLSEAKVQYDNYISAEVTKNFQSFEEKALPETAELTYDQENLLNNIRILQTALDNWDSVIKYHKDNSRFDLIREDYTEEEIVEYDDEGNPVDETSAETSQEFKDGSVGKKTLTQLAQKEVLYILKSLFKIENNTTVENKLGFKELADFPKLWQIVTREIGTVKDPYEMYNKLVEASKTHSPELEQLIKNKFPDPNSIKRDQEFNILTSFWQTFSRARVKYIQLTAWPERGMNEFGEPSNEVVGWTVDVGNASIDAANIIKKFEAKFDSATIAENKYITRVDNIPSLSKIKELVKDFGNPYNPATLNIDKSFEFAKSIGIMFDNVQNIKDELKAKPDDYGLPYLFKMVYDIAEMQKKKTPKGSEIAVINQFMTAPLKMFMQKHPGSLFPSFDASEVYQRSIIKKLAELQGRFGYDGSSYSVLNPEKNLVNEYIDDHSISRTVDGINRAQFKTDLWTKKEFKYLSWLNPKINTFTNRSQILNSIFKRTGTQERYKDKSLELFIDSGTQIAEFDTGSVTTSLDIYSKFLQEMNMMLKAGVQEFIRHASKKSSFGVRIEGGIESFAGKGTDPRLYVDIEMFSPERLKFTESYVADNIMIPYLASEFHRVVKFKNNRETFMKIKGYNQNIGTKENPIYSGEVLTFFDNVLTDETKKQLLSEEFIKSFSNSDMTLENYLKKDATLKSLIKQDITNYFNEQSSENYDVFSQSPFVDTDLVNKIKSSTKLSKSEENQILVKTYTINSWIHNFETANLFYGDGAQFNYAKEELHKRNTGSTSGGPKFLTGTIAENFINDVWNKETYASKYAKRTGKPEYNKFTNFDSTITTAVIKDVERVSEYIGSIEKGLRKDYESRGWSKERVERVLKTDLETYQEMNEADGAGYITIDAYRTLKKLENAWNPKQEELYQKIINNNPINASDVSNFFPVYKLQYFGALSQTEADAIAPITAMHKFALAPLIPSVIKNTELEKLHHRMLSQNVQYVTFESGSKMGSVTKDGKPDNAFLDKEQKLFNEAIEFTPNKIYLEYLKVATNVNSKYKGETTFPTQLRGLILDGLYEKGDISKEKYKELGQDYHQIVSDYTETLKLELLNEIGFEEKDGKYVGDFTRFMEMLQKELGKRDMPAHLIRMIGTTPSGKVKTDLSLHLEADTIEKMLISVATKRLVKQKVKGEALVQVPSTMYNGLWDNTVRFDKANPEEVIKYMGTNNLPFYEPGKDGTNAMKIAIALQGDFINLLNLEYNNEPIKTLDRLNEAIKDDKWLNIDNNRKAISLSGARIPIQNLNSMEFAEVWHFLDPSAGNQVVVPTELVAKSGSDFDVDKIFWMMPHIDSRGSYVTGVLSQQELKEKIKNKEKSAQVIKKQKRALENKLIDFNNKILSISENYASLIRPNHTYLVKDFADKYGEYMESYDRFRNMHKEPVKTDPNKESKKRISPTRTLEVQYNLLKHDVNMVGKDTLGIVAQQNKKHPILKSIGATMPNTYMSQSYNDITKQYYDTYREYDMRLLLPHNKVKDSEGKTRISISNNYNVEGDRIADLYSHMMNGLLDVEKDAWVFYIQANLQEVGVLNYLLEAGVPAETAILFVSQPMIRDYALKQKMLSSTYATIIDKKLTPFHLIKSQAANKVLGQVRKEKVVDILNQVNNINLDKAIQQIDPNKNDYEIVVNKTKYVNASGQRILDQLRDDKLNISNLTSIQDPKEPSEKYVYNKTKSLVSNDGYYDSATVAASMEGVLKNGELSKEKLIEVLTGKDSSDNLDFQIATFLHFIEIEKQIKGLESVKRQSNPDTKFLNSIQQIKKREANYVSSLDNSKVDPEMVRKLRNESILSSFYVNEIAVDLLEPIMPLRLNEKVLNFANGKINSDLSTIQNRFGVGTEGEERFVNEFNNGVVNYIFQNYMSNFINQDGAIVDLPSSYRKMSVIKKPGIKNGAEVVDGVVYVDVRTLNSEFSKKTYLNTYKGMDSYSEKGLLPFKSFDNPFPTQASYNRYVIEREYLRSVYPQEATTAEEKTKYEKFLNQRALLNVFNKDAIMGTSEYSYTDLVIKTIEEFKHLKSRYPVLEQISKIVRGKNKILQLNNKDFAKADLAEAYYQNIRELADPNIRKVFSESKDPEVVFKAAEDNRRLSEVFQLFSLMAIHQHGVGYNKYGFNKILDDSDYLEVMRSAAVIFTETSLNNDSLSHIYNTLTGEASDRFFKNYVRNPESINKINSINQKEASKLNTFADSLTEVYGQEVFDKAIAETYPELSIVDVPENMSVEEFMSEGYEDYVQATYTSIKTILDRLIRNGVDTDNVDFIFYDFSNDKNYKLSEVLALLGNIEDVIMPDEVIETTEPVTEEEGVSGDKNTGLYPDLTEYYDNLLKIDKAKLGNLDDLIEKYAENFSKFYTEKEYIEYLKNCL
jgi:hypothetical protein